MSKLMQKGVAILILYKQKTGLREGKGPPSATQ